MTSTRLFLFIIGTFLIAFGSAAPFLPRNYFIGVRVLWTLRDDRVWRQTHRFAAITSIVGGIVAFAFGLFGDLAHQWTALIVAAALLPPVVYSWLLDRRLRADR